MKTPVGESKYWDDRYKNDEFGWDIGYANPAILDYFENVPKEAHILIPGCGLAHEGEALWLAGFRNLYLMDFAETSRDRFLRRVPTFPINQFWRGDFFSLQRPQKFDYVVEQTFFCAIDPKMRSQYAEKMIELLNPGGKLVGVMFNVPLNEDHPPFGGSKAEYESVFSKHFDNLSFIPCDKSIPQRAGRELWVEMQK